MATNRYSAPKAPTDLTGRKGVQLAKEQAEKQEREAAELASKDRAARKSASMITASIRRRAAMAGGDDPVPPSAIRVAYPIEEMTFGREVVDPGEYNEYGGLTRPPVLGPLRMFTFEEGPATGPPEMPASAPARAISTSLHNPGDKRKNGAKRGTRRLIRATDAAPAVSAVPTSAGYRSDASTCSDLHKKHGSGSARRYSMTCYPGLSRITQYHVTSRCNPGHHLDSGASAIGIAGAASRRLNRASNGRPRIIPGGTFGLYNMRPPGSYRQGAVPGQSVISTGQGWQIRRLPLI